MRSELTRKIDRLDSSWYQEQRQQLSDVASNAFGYLMSLPSLLFILLVVGFPLGYLAYLSFMQDVVGLMAEPQFVALENFVSVLTNATYWVYLGNTLFYAIAVVVGGLTIALGITVALNADLPYRRLWQTLIILPWAVPFVLSTLMWRLMFNPQYGLINYLLVEVGLVGAPIQWFSGKWTAFFTIIVTTIWINTPLSVLILLAGRQTIPDSMYEAARLDGAGIWARFRHITLPLLRPAILTVVVLQSMLALRGFDIIFAMTGGGPGDATTVVAIDIYNNLIRFGNIEYAAAESVSLIVIIFVFLGLMLKLFGSNREVNV